ncbi:MAG: restriction endonuclease, SacI family [Treponema sp.]|nr:restriction endonuclease, SacI family [Treponema sp.]MCL2250805.1 restriction endonuclease, SacI family [Treponema sp.]
MGTEQTIPDYPRGITFEQVWAALMEDRKAMEELREAHRKNERLFEETAIRIEETDRQIKETSNQMKETDKKMGDLYNRFGEIAEHLVAPNINKRFNELGYHFGSYSGIHKIDDNNGNRIAEIDILLENSEFLMAIEVKTKPNLKDVDSHLKRMQILRESRDRIKDKRKVQGAIAGAIFGSDVKKATIEAGLYVIEQSGDTMMITVPQGFIPREW